jgi:hypothetical protein
MKHKKLLRPDRLRRPPERFSWLDHRLVRENRLNTCTPDALALYLFLATVADAEGLSYYGEASCAQRLGMDTDRLRAARACLIREDLIAYERPFYQVLSLDRPPTPPPPPCSPEARTSPRSGQARSFAEILSEMGGAS